MESFYVMDGDNKIIKAWLGGCLNASFREIGFRNTVQY